MPYGDPDKQRKFQREMSRKRRGILQSLKNHPCMDCHQIFPPYVMEWDHRPGEKKFHNISAMNRYSIPRCLEEIAKCDLVCANCHRVRTHSRIRLI